MSTPPGQGYSAVATPMFHMCSTALDPAWCSSSTLTVCSATLLGSLGRSVLSIEVRYFCTPL